MKAGMMNLDSLTDIVSNSIGIMVILAIIAVLIGKKKVYDIEVPIEQETSKVAKYFFCKSDAIIHIDAPRLFMNAIRVIRENNIEPGEHFDLLYQGLVGELRNSPASPSPFLSVYPEDISSWEGRQSIEDGSSNIRLAFESLHPDSHFAYFFVYDNTGSDKFADDDTFVTFTKARAFLNKRGVDTGWRPVDDGDHRAYLCYYIYEPNCCHNPSLRGEEGPTNK